MNKNNPQKKTTKIIVLIAIIEAIAIVVAGIILIALGGFPNDFLSAGASEDTEASANSSGKDNENDTYYADEYDENYQLRHAPNMYVDWVSSSNYEGAYDAFIID